MENPKSLQNLIGKNKILFSDNEIVLKISFHSKDDTLILSSMSYDLKLEFSILSADIGNYNSGIIGNIFISSKIENKNLIKEYLSKKNILFHEVSNTRGDRV